MENYWWIWMLVAAFFVVAEVFTAGFFMLWFGIGAAIAGLLALVGLGLVWQLVFFVAVSTALFLFSRQFAERVSAKQPPGIGADRFVGQTAVVLEEINPHKNTGRIRVGQDEWRAYSDDGKPIAVDKAVKVIRVDGTRLVVQVLQEGV